MQRFTKKFVNFHGSWPLKLLEQFKSKDVFFVLPDFISNDEERILVDEIEPQMKRMRYEPDHPDDQIVLYREREQEKWSDRNQKIIDRIGEKSFPQSSRLSPYVHILDLHKDGYIKPHIDATRYCGGTISGLSLLSDSVMRLHAKDQKLMVDLYLPRRSLYKLSDIARFMFKHEILADEESYFDGAKVPRGRRISILRRDYPETSKQEPDIIVEKIGDTYQK